MYPKSVLGRRTPAQYEFDMAIKGWAFMQTVSPQFLVYAESKLPSGDAKRAATLAAIKSRAT